MSVWLRTQFFLKDAPAKFQPDGASGYLEDFLCVPIKGLLKAGNKLSSSECRGGLRRGALLKCKPAENCAPVHGIGARGGFGGEKGGGRPLRRP